MARALRCPSASLGCSLSRSKTSRAGEMEHSLVCSVETGGEGLWLFKATNKLVGEAPVRPRCILGEQEPFMADPIACLPNAEFRCCVAKQGEGGQSMLQGLLAPGPAGGGL